MAARLVNPRIAYAIDREYYDLSFDACLQIRNPTDVICIGERTLAGSPLLPSETRNDACHMVQVIATAMVRLYKGCTAVQFVEHLYRQEPFFK